MIWSAFITLLLYILESRLNFILLCWILISFHTVQIVNILENAFVVWKSKDNWAFFISLGIILSSARKQTQPTYLKHLKSFPDTNRTDSLTNSSISMGSNNWNSSHLDFVFPAILSLQSFKIGIHKNLLHRLIPWNFFV